jgi:hypothetical protein
VEGSSSATHRDEPQTPRRGPLAGGIAATLFLGARLGVRWPRAVVMREYLKFFIDGQWVEPAELETLDVENPATELVVGKIALGSAADVDRAVNAARVAFAAWSRTSREERLDVLNRIVMEYEKALRRLGDRCQRGDGRPCFTVPGRSAASWP